MAHPSSSMSVMKWSRPDPIKTSHAAGNYRNNQSQTPYNYNAAAALQREHINRSEFGHTNNDDDESGSNDDGGDDDGTGNNIKVQAAGQMSQGISNFKNSHILGRSMNTSSTHKNIFGGGGSGSDHSGSPANNTPKAYYNDSVSAGKNTQNQNIDLNWDPTTSIVPGSKSVTNGGFGFHSSINHNIIRANHRKQENSVDNHSRVKAKKQIQALPGRKRFANAEQHHGNNNYDLDESNLPPGVTKASEINTHFEGQDAILNHPFKVGESGKFNKKQSPQDGKVGVEDSGSDCSDGGRSGSRPGMSSKDSSRINGSASGLSKGTQGSRSGQSSKSSSNTKFRGKSSDSSHSRSSRSDSEDSDQPAKNKVVGIGGRMAPYSLAAGACGDVSGSGVLKTDTASTNTKDGMRKNVHFLNKGGKTSDSSNSAIANNMKKQPNGEVQQHQKRGRFEQVKDGKGAGSPKRGHFTDVETSALTDTQPHWQENAANNSQSTSHSQQTRAARWKARKDKFEREGGVHQPGIIFTGNTDNNNTENFYIPPNSPRNQILHTPRGGVQGKDHHIISLSPKSMQANTTYQMNQPDHNKGSKFANYSGPFAELVNPDEDKDGSRPETPFGIHRVPSWEQVGKAPVTKKFSRSKSSKGGVIGQVGSRSNTNNSLGSNSLNSIMGSTTVDTRSGTGSDSNSASAGLSGGKLNTKKNTTLMRKAAATSGRDASDTDSDSDDKKQQVNMGKITSSFSVGKFDGESDSDDGNQQQNLNNDTSKGNSNKGNNFNSMNKSSSDTENNSEESEQNYFKKPVKGKYDHLKPGKIQDNLENKEKQRLSQKQSNQINVLNNLGQDTDLFGLPKGTRPVETARNAAKTAIGNATKTALSRSVSQSQSSDGSGKSEDNNTNVNSSYPNLGAAAAKKFGNSRVKKVDRSNSPYQDQYYGSHSNQNVNNYNNNQLSATGRNKSDTNNYTYGSRTRFSDVDVLGQNNMPDSTFPNQTGIQKYGATAGYSLSLEKPTGSVKDIFKEPIAPQETDDKLKEKMLTQKGELPKSEIGEIFTVKKFIAPKTGTGRRLRGMEGTSHESNKVGMFQQYDSDGHPLFPNKKGVTRKPIERPSARGIKYLQRSQSFSLKMDGNYSSLLYDQERKQGVEELKEYYKVQGLMVRGGPEHNNSLWKKRKMVKQLSQATLDDQREMDRLKLLPKQHGGYLSDQSGPDDYGNLDLGLTRKRDISPKIGTPQAFGESLSGDYDQNQNLPYSDTELYDPQFGKTRSQRRMRKSKSQQKESPGSPLHFNSAFNQVPLDSTLSQKGHAMEFETRPMKRVSTLDARSSLGIGGFKSNRATSEHDRDGISIPYDSDNDSEENNGNGLDGKGPGNSKGAKHYNGSSVQLKKNTSDDRDASDSDESVDFRKDSRAASTSKDTNGNNSDNKLQTDEDNIIAKQSQAPTRFHRVDTMQRGKRIGRKVNLKTREGAAGFDTLGKEGKYSNRKAAALMHSDYSKRLEQMAGFMKESQKRRTWKDDPNSFRNTNGVTLPLKPHDKVKQDQKFNPFSENSPFLIRTGELKDSKSIKSQRQELRDLKEATRVATNLSVYQPKSLSGRCYNEVVKWKNRLGAAITTGIGAKKDAYDPGSMTKFTEPGESTNENYELLDAFDKTYSNGGTGGNQQQDVTSSIIMSKHLNAGGGKKLGDINRIYHGMGEMSLGISQNQLFKDHKEYEDQNQKDNSNNMNVKQPGGYSHSSSGTDNEDTAYQEHLNHNLYNPHSKIEKKNAPGNLISKSVAVGLKAVSPTGASGVVKTPTEKTKERLSQMRNNKTRASLILDKAISERQENPLNYLTSTQTLGYDGEREDERVKLEQKRDMEEHYVKIKQKEEEAKRQNQQRIDKLKSEGKIIKNYFDDTHYSQLQKDGESSHLPFPPNRHQVAEKEIKSQLKKDLQDHLENQRNEWKETEQRNDPRDYSKNRHFNGQSMVPSMKELAVEKFDRQEESAEKAASNKAEAIAKMGDYRIPMRLKRNKDEHLDQSLIGTDDGKNKFIEKAYHGSAIHDLNEEGWAGVQSKGVFRDDIITNKRLRRGEKPEQTAQRRQDLLFFEEMGRNKLDDLGLDGEQKSNAFKDRQFKAWKSLGRSLDENWRASQDLRSAGRNSMQAKQFQQHAGRLWEEMGTHTDKKNEQIKQESIENLKDHYKYFDWNYSSNPAEKALGRKEKDGGDRNGRDDAACDNDTQDDKLNSNQQNRLKQASFFPISTTVIDRTRNLYRLITKTAKQGKRLSGRRRNSLIEIASEIKDAPIHTGNYTNEYLDNLVAHPETNPLDHLGEDMEKWYGERRRKMNEERKMILDMKRDQEELDKIDREEQYKINREQKEEELKKLKEYKQSKGKYDSTEDDREMVEIERKNVPAMDADSLAWLDDEQEKYNERTRIATSKMMQEGVKNELDRTLPGAKSNRVKKRMEKLRTNPEKNYDIATNSILSQFFEREDELKLRHKENALEAWQEHLKKDRATREFHESKRLERAESNVRKPLTAKELETKVLETRFDKKTGENIPDAFKTNIEFDKRKQAEMDFMLQYVEKKQKENEYKHFEQLKEKTPHLTDMSLNPLVERKKKLREYIPIKNDDAFREQHNDKLYIDSKYGNVDDDDNYFLTAQVKDKNLQDQFKERCRDYQRDMERSMDKRTKVRAYRERIEDLTTKRLADEDRDKRMGIDLIGKNGYQPKDELLQGMRRSMQNNHPAAPDYKNQNQDLRIGKLGHNTMMRRMNYTDKFYKEDVAAFFQESRERRDLEDDPNLTRAPGLLEFNRRHNRTKNGIAEKPNNIVMEEVREMADIKKELSVLNKDNSKEVLSDIEGKNHDDKLKLRVPRPRTVDASRDWAYLHYETPSYGVHHPQSAELRGDNSHVSNWRINGIADTIAYDSVERSRVKENARRKEQKLLQRCYQLQAEKKFVEKYPSRPSILHAEGFNEAEFIRSGTHMGEMQAEKSPFKEDVVQKHVVGKRLGFDKMNSRHISQSRAMAQADKLPQKNANHEQHRDHITNQRTDQDRQGGVLAGKSDHNKNKTTFGRTNSIRNYFNKIFHHPGPKHQNQIHGTGSPEDNVSQHEIDKDYDHQLNRRGDGLGSLVLAHKVHGGPHRGNTKEELWRQSEYASGDSAANEYEGTQYPPPTTNDDHYVDYGRLVTQSGHLSRAHERAVNLLNGGQRIAEAKSDLRNIEEELGWQSTQLNTMKNSKTQSNLNGNRKTFNGTMKNMSKYGTRSQGIVTKRGDSPTSNNSNSRSMSPITASRQQGSPNPLGSRSLESKNDTYGVHKRKGSFIGNVDTSKSHEIHMQNVLLDNIVSNVKNDYNKSGGAGQAGARKLRFGESDEFISNNQVFSSTGASNSDSLASAIESSASMSGYNSYTGNQDYYGQPPKNTNQYNSDDSDIERRVIDKNELQHRGGSRKHFGNNVVDQATAHTETTYRMSRESKKKRNSFSTWLRSTENAAKEAAIVNRDGFGAGIMIHPIDKSVPGNDYSKDPGVNYSTDYHPNSKYPNPNKPNQNSIWHYQDRSHYGNPGNHNFGSSPHTAGYALSPKSFVSGNSQYNQSGTYSHLPSSTSNFDSNYNSNDIRAVPPIPTRPKLGPGVFSRFLTSKRRRRDAASNDCLDGLSVLPDKVNAPVKTQSGFEIHRAVGSLIDDTGRIKRTRGFVA